MTNIALDTSNSNITAGATSVTITIASNNNRLVILQASYIVGGGTGSAQALSTVAIGASNFTKLQRHEADSGGNSAYTEIWYLIAPPTGAQTITVTWASTPTHSVLSAISLYNVDQITGINSGSVNNGGGDTLNPSVSITPTNKNSWILGAMASGATPSAQNQTSIFLGTVDSSSNVTASAQYNATPTINSSNTLSWTQLTGSVCSLIAYEVLSFGIKSVSDSPSFVDSVVKIIAKNISDSISLSDSIQKSINKAISDTISISDSINVKPSTFKLSDNILTSDLVQVSKTITKNVVDTLSVGDSIQKSIAKTISDSESLTDSLSKNIGKNISDNFSLIDSISKSIIKLIQENPTISDSTSVSKTIIKSISDSLSIVDSLVISREIVRSMVDNLSIGDNISKSLGKSLSDNPVLAEQLSKAISKIITDNISIPDSIIKNIGSLLLNQTRRINLNNTTQQIIAEGKPRNVTI